MYPERQRWVVKLDFVGANRDVQPVGEERTEAVISYFKGPQDQWHAGLPTYSRIVYRDLWPGIDLVYYGTVNALKYEFVVHPGADPSQIRLTYCGAESVTLNAAGQLEVTTPVGSFADDVPIAYQDIDSQRVPVSAAYTFQDVVDRSSASQQSYAFTLGPYDPAHSLILDPVVLVYCGYIGGSDGDYVGDIAVDDGGNAYVTGLTMSSEASFPVSGGPDLTFNGDRDIFVAKVNATGTGLIYAGYIGGNDYDNDEGIAVDSAGNAYVTGHTKSTEASFPVSGGPDLTYNGGDADAFVAKINATGTDLYYAGYIGGEDYDWGGDIAVDGVGSVYVIGGTSSTEASFPVVVGPDLTHNDGWGGDVFVAKVNATGTALVYAGYIGGDGLDRGYGIAVDSAGYAFVTGETGSDEATFPVTGGPDLILDGYYDAFVAKVDVTGTTLIYCGYIGGGGSDHGNGIAVDSVGNAYVTGEAASNEASFPVVGGPDLTYNGMTDAFVAKVNVTGTALIYAGYIGGYSRDVALDIAVDGVGSAYVTGHTGSTEASFPVTGGPNLAYGGGYTDVFVAKISKTGSDLVYAGYIGGSDGDNAYGIAVDGMGSAYIIGRTGSTEASFPVTGGPDLTYNGGDSDAFVAKVATAFFVSGRVTDEDTNPIADVLVLTDAGLNATTGVSGYYTLTTVLPGIYTLMPTLSGASFLPVTRTVTITSTDVSGQDFTGAIAPTSVTIDGPLTGTVGTVYTFTAVVTPVTTTMPITYTWTPEPASGQGTTTATYSWTSPSSQAITVTVTNAGGAVMAPHSIEIKCLLFLPLVLRNY